MDGRLLFYLQELKQDLEVGFDHNKKATIPHHPHELVFKESRVEKNCDVCAKRNLLKTYRCLNKACDFDACMSCVAHNVDVQVLPSELN